MLDHGYKNDSSYFCRREGSSSRSLPLDHSLNTEILQYIWITFTHYLTTLTLYLLYVILSLLQLH